MVILLKIAATVAFLFGVIFLYLPGGFGILHFNRGRSKAVARGVSVLWVAFMLVHLLAIYRTWFSADSVYAWLVALFLGQVVFFTTVARDVSTT
ncbi:hypothetical protein [Oleiagrimonas soli]|uniref:Uncharacterized protein n=1 Tax=Oleiagrimonas soli TaxID=1543381 RepID=A0A099CZ02_9GAMM|nr:hypothetical protein [Oleiagrimonas soli]KGI78842.1 hypothetical protein LF63_0102600 [Oleiagrimonas soli]MBB6184365.1 hypothetical protein [Oleiagrimonas soli]